MDAVFLELLNRSIAAGWLILAVVLLRLLLNRAPKNLRCLLWAFVPVRMLLPARIDDIAQWFLQFRIQQDDLMAFSRDSHGNLKIHAVISDRMIEDRFQIPMLVHPEYSLIDIDLFQIFDGRFPAQDDSIDFYDSFFDSIHVFSSHDTYDISDYSRNSFQKPPAQKSF